MHVFRSPDLDFPKIDFRNNINASAELFFDNLRDVIRAYEAQLDEKHQLIWEIACLNGKEYQVCEMGYINPSLIRFKTVDPSGARCELLVHVASVQFILREEEVACEVPKRRIGFQQS